MVEGFKGEEYGAWQVGSGELISLLKPMVGPRPIPTGAAESWRDTSASLGGGTWVAASYGWRRGSACPPMMQCPPSLCEFRAYLYTAGDPVELQRTHRECGWRGRVGVSTHGRDAWVLSPDSLSRYSFPAGGALVGFSESGRLQRSGSISVSVERAGDLSVPMVVTWSIAQVGLGGRPAGEARLRSISFGSNFQSTWTNLENGQSVQSRQSGPEKIWDLEFDWDEGLLTVHYSTTGAERIITSDGSVVVRSGKRFTRLVIDLWSGEAVDVEIVSLAGRGDDFEALLCELLSR